jgi:hypothetical protein
VHEKERQEVLDLVLVKKIVEETIDHSDNQGPEHSLISMERNPNDGRVGQCPPLILILD